MRFTLTRSDDLTTQQMKITQRKPADDFLSRKNILPVSSSLGRYMLCVFEGKNFYLFFLLLFCLLTSFSPSLACYEPFSHGIRAAIDTPERNSRNSFSHARFGFTFSHTPGSLSRTKRVRFLAIVQGFSMVSCVSGWKRRPTQNSKQKHLSQRTSQPDLYCIICCIIIESETHVWAYHEYKQKYGKCRFTSLELSAYFPFIGSSSSCSTAKKNVKKKKRTRASSIYLRSTYLFCTSRFHARNQFVLLLFVREKSAERCSKMLK